MASRVGFDIGDDDDDIPGEEIVYQPQGGRQPVEAVEELDPDTLDAFVNQDKMREETPDDDDNDPIDYDEPDPSHMPQHHQPQHGQWNPYQQSPEEVPSEGYATLEEEKADLLNRLQRLKKKGFTTSKNLNTNSSIKDIRTEYKRIMYGIEVDQSIKFSRRALMAVVTGLEFLNKRYDPFDLALDGWSESVYGSVSDYDSVFEELYHKYHSKVNVAPEIKLLMMLGGSAMMFHLSSSMFKNSNIPNLGDVLNNNPDLMSQVMSAVGGGGAATSGGAGPASTDRPREMKPPSLDMGALLQGAGIGPGLPTMGNMIPKMSGNTDDPTEGLDSISDLVSETPTEELKNIAIAAPRKRRGRSTKKASGNEVTI